MIDNAYRHVNKADNLRSLRRVRSPSPDGDRPGS
jgi:hypothetical protein